MRTALKKVGVLTVERDLYCSSFRNNVEDKGFWNHPEAHLVDLMGMTAPIYPVFTDKQAASWLGIKLTDAKVILEDALCRGHYFKKGNKYSESWRELGLNRAVAFKQRTLACRRAYKKKRNK